MSDRLHTYAGGPLAVSAVPGAGKTHMLTELAVRLVTERGVPPSEILVLTYMREAAEQLRSRLTGALASRGHRPAGLTVTTIHAFCLGLLREAEAAPRRTLAESERTQILFAALDRYLEDPQRRRAWELAHPPAGRYDDPRRETVEAARQALSVAKLHGLTLDSLPPDLAAMAAHYEAERQRLGALDFDDQIREALTLLEARPELLARLRARHRYLLEDEAQDSTVAQARLLSLLAGEGGHLVRVGDPNQAITSTFTASDPREFRAFCDRLAAAGRHLTIVTSSRSGAPLLAIANHLVALAARHPDPVIASALAPVTIAPTGRLNPPPAECGAAFHAYETADRERLGVLAAIRRHLARHPEDRVAVLLPTNREVDRYTELFSHAGLPVVAGASPRLPAQVLAMLEATLRAI
ncbi:MAG: UvrD-helicase domain-containing protein, partial [Candidatus Sericytochromatia bacterium]